MDSLRDTIAKAIDEVPVMAGTYNMSGEDSDALADAALSAIKAAGLVIVPREPTETMVEVGAQDFNGDLVARRGACEIYSAMIAAAEGKG